MTPSSNADSDATATDRFEAALRTIVLESFARGAAIQGTWEVTPPSSVVPDWRITIEKIDAADPPRDGATFLDE